MMTTGVFGPVSGRKITDRAVETMRGNFMMVRGPHVRQIAQMSIRRFSNQYPPPTTTMSKKEFIGSLDCGTT